MTEDMFMDFPLGAEVHCTDGRCGRSTHIILNPATEEITHLVVRGKRPDRIERLVPVRLVTSTAADAILLKCTLKEFAALERFNSNRSGPSVSPHRGQEPHERSTQSRAFSAASVREEGVQRRPTE